MSELVLEKAKASPDAVQMARLFASCIPVGVFVADAAGKFTFTNKWLAEKLETSQEELTENSCFDFVHLDDRTRIRDAWLDLWEEDMPYEVKHRAITRSGAVHVFRCKAAKFINEKGLCRVMGVVEDISEKQKMLSQLDRIWLGFFHRIERGRGDIALELHDSVAQDLCLLKLKIQSAGHESGRDEWLRLLSSAITRIDGLAFRLSPLNLEMLGLTAAITDLMVAVGRVQGAHFHSVLRLDGLDEAIPKYYAIQIYRIVHDAVENVVKDTDATKITLQTRREENHFFLVVSDNGQSLYPSRRRKDSFGIRIMQERARLIGARLTFSEGRFGGEVSIAIRSKLL